MGHFHIQPLITLNHWDYPMWVYRQGGWTSRKTVNDFAALTTVLAKRYSHQVRYWLTFNEEVRREGELSAGRCSRPIRS